MVCQVHLLPADVLMLVASPGTGVPDAVNRADAGFARRDRGSVRLHARHPSRRAGRGWARRRAAYQRAMAMNSALNYSICAGGWASFAVFVLDVSSLAPVHDSILTRPRVMTWLCRTFAGGFALLGAKLALAGR
jgi:hypothetical protein